MNLPLPTGVPTVNVDVNALFEVYQACALIAHTLLRHFGPQMSTNFFEIL
jgi:hypothetical protein